MMHFTMFNLSANPSIQTGAMAQTVIEIADSFLSSGWRSRTLQVPTDEKIELRANLRPPIPRLKA